jgi:hypothetical protein
MTLKQGILLHSAYDTLKSMSKHFPISQGPAHKSPVFDFESKGDEDLQRSDEGSASEEGDDRPTDDDAPAVDLEGGQGAIEVHDPHPGWDMYGSD